MTTPEQIEAYIASQSEPKRGDMRALHQAILQVMPDAPLWFLDGRNEAGKIVANPNIGYGLQTKGYADGTSREFYQTGLSANTTGLSVYILGIEDKTSLSRTFGQQLGKASVTGYCIRFKRLSDIDLAVLQAAIRHGIAVTSGNQPNPHPVTAS